MCFGICSLLNGKETLLPRVMSFLPQEVALIKGAETEQQTYGASPLQHAATDWLMPLLLGQSFTGMSCAVSQAIGRTFWDCRFRPCQLYWKHVHCMGVHTALPLFLSLPTSTGLMRELRGILLPGGWKRGELGSSSQSPCQKPGIFLGLGMNVGQIEELRILVSYVSGTCLLYFRVSETLFTVCEAGAELHTVLTAALVLAPFLCWEKRWLVMGEVTNRRRQLSCLSPGLGWLGSPFAHLNAQIGFCIGQEHFNPFSLQEVWGTLLP